MNINILGNNNTRDLIIHEVRLELIPGAWHDIQAVQPDLINKKVIDLVLI